MSLKDRERYAEQLQSLAKKGYFILDNGMKSCDTRSPKKTDLRPKQQTLAALFFVGPQLKRLVATENLK